MPTVDALALMRERNARMHSAASVARGTTGFAPRASDVFIATYPKTGTTWMMQICHQIRCEAARARGEDANGEAFDEITEVVPWDVVALDCGQDLDAAQTTTPRLFKSHESATTMARGARSVVVTREPADVFHSFYEFLPAYMGIERGAITREEFAEAIFAGASHSGGFAEHYLSWYDAATASRDDVLMVAFEDMKEDLGAVVDDVAAFLRCELDARGRDVVLERASFAYMRKNHAKFDDHFVRARVAEQIGLPKASTFSVGKVREGGGAVGAGARELPQTVRDAIQARWDARMAPRGFKTYDAFRAALRDLRR